VVLKESGSSCCEICVLCMLGAGGAAIHLLPRLLFSSLPTSFDKKYIKSLCASSMLVFDPLKESQKAETLGAQQSSS
jgi:hypothetical protein